MSFVTVSLGCLTRIFVGSLCLLSIFRVSLVPFFFFFFLFSFVPVFFAFPAFPASLIGLSLSMRNLFAL